MIMSLKDHKKAITCISTNPKNPKHVITASEDGSCIVWNLDTKGRLHCLMATTSFMGVKYLGDETQIVTVGSDRKLTYWDATDGTSIRVLEASTSASVNDIDLS